MDPRSGRGSVWEPGHFSLTEAVNMTSQGRQKSPCVVVVEDHMDSCHALVRLLERAGYSVVSAHSVNEAREAVVRYGCDLLIADLGLPDGSGLELAREVRAMHLRTKAIAVSGYTETRTKQRVRRRALVRLCRSPSNSTS